MTSVVDAHHHLWDPARRDYPWMTGPAAGLRRPYGLSELREETAATGIDRTVVVQAVSEPAETEELLAAAAASGGLIGAVVGWVDLTAPDLPEQLARLRDGPGGHRLTGIRHQVHDEPDADWLIRPDVLRGLAELAEHGFSYDLLVRARELPAAQRAARAVDELSFILDHGGKPPIASGSREPWVSRLTELAALPNVTCKISGLVTEAEWESWTVDDLRTYSDSLLELFTPGRLMFGSDWPVCTLAAGYAEVLAAARECLSGLSDSESAAVFAGNATAIYRL